jgi:putative redox protein
MTEARARWTENDTYVGEAGTGHEVTLDAGGHKAGNSPVEMVLIALCACTASDVVSILRKKREPLTALEVRATADRAETFPKVFTAIHVIYRVGGKVTHKAVEDAVRLSKEKYCSVSAMLEKSAKIDVVIEYAE